ncbi:MAG TPA: radical SAM protein [Terriglobales bacterium]|nr:radical SAM protein [Terriglobales bacterium]
MRVLLIYPKRDPESRVRTQFSMERIHELTFWPLRGKSYGLQFNGLEALASLTPDWVDLTVINENLKSIDLEADVDMVAITVMVTNATRAYQIADHFRRRKIKVVMGGYHPFMIPQNSLVHADAICTTEAEYVWEDILKDCRDGKLKQIYQQAEKTDMSKALHLNRVKRWEWLHQISLTLQASRGCPFSCDFCSIVQMLGHDMRYKTPENLCRELEVIFKHDIMGRIFYRPIFFVDDNIFGHPRTLKELLRAIIKLRARYPKFKPVFGSQMTINVYKDKEALSLLEEAGFYNIFMGLESQDPETLRSYNKLHNIAFKYDDAIQTMREHGMEVIASFIFGTDSDTPASFDAAFDFFDRCNVLYPYFNILTPTANQWKRFLAEGRILTVKAKLYDAHHTVFVPMKMTPRQLQEGFMNLVSRTFDYTNLTKRMLGIYVNGPQREVKLALPLPVEKLMYHKLHFTLGRRGDGDSQRFLEDLKPHIFAGKIPIASVLLQIDQHDWAVRNRETLAEHRYSLDVPAWQDRPREATVNAGTGLASEIAAHVR